MKKRLLVLLMALALLTVLALLTSFTEGSVARVPIRTFPAPAPRARTFADVLRIGTRVGFCTLETGQVAIPRASMLRRDHTRSDVAREHEPLPIFAHLVRHPTRGDVLVDTGLDVSFVRDAFGDMRVPAQLVHQALGARFALREGEDLASQLARLGASPRVVLFTHVHGDHTAGVPALHRTTRLVLGPGEHADVAAHVGYGHITRPIEVLDARRAFALPPFRSVLDVFGDASVLAIATPGHSRGHTSYLVNTIDGPVLLTGDAAHTVFAFEHGIGPTGPSADDERTAQASLDALRLFAQMHPEVRVVLGHEAPARLCTLHH